MPFIDTVDTSWRIALTAEEDVDGSIQFAVTDTGSGIAQDELPHLFERYWQGDAKRRGSLGLGLYICKQIIEIHGGCIGVDTQLVVYADEGHAFKKLDDRKDVVRRIVQWFDAHLR